MHRLSRFVTPLLILVFIITSQMAKRKKSQFEKNRDRINQREKRAKRRAATHAAENERFVQSALESIDLNTAANTIVSNCYFRIRIGFFRIFVVCCVFVHFPEFRLTKNSIFS